MSMTASVTPSIATSKTRDAMGRAAAADVGVALRDRLARQSTARMIFAAAPSQAEMLDALARERDIDWRRVTAFHMDEYIGLPSGAPERFGAWLTRHLFSRVAFGTVHLIGQEPDPDREAARYAALLAEAPIDIICLGIGVNGHLAFNDPPVADLHDTKQVKVVELDAICRQQQVDDGCFPTLGHVPTHAITLTIPRLLDAGQLFCVVPGASKRTAVERSLYGPIGTACPASALRTHPRCALYLDPDSTPPQLSPQTPARA
ncbi:glucosamine-6-phosphate deaminase [Bradyrhizobium niftali]|nr:glucosamine-6-phosphate deaminase [Bradyrhizobium niftali]